MNYININDLVILDNRQRREFPRKELDDLKRSILSKGLLHPPVVRNDGVTLVAGERRARAIRELYGEGHSIECNGVEVISMQLPVNKLSDLDPLDVLEAELEENVVRLDLSWQDKARATTQLNDLRQAQAAQEGKTFTVKELQAEIKGSPGHANKTKEMLILGNNLHHPEVAKAKTHKEAVKALKKIKEKEWREELSAKVDLTKTEHIVKLGSLVDLFPDVDSDSFDLLLADPPYGIDADKFGDMSDTGHNYKDSWDHAKELYGTIAKEGFRVTKAEAHGYIFCAHERFQEISDLFDLAGWTVWPRPIIWSKGNGMLPRPEHGPRYTYECILFVSKGNKKTLFVRSDVISLPGDRKLSHGAQKPVDLYVDLISRSCLPGSRIIDPTGGSGTTISAATKTRCTVTLFEIERDNYNLCLQRLEGGSLDLDEEDEDYVELDIIDLGVDL